MDLPAPNTININTNTDFNINNINRSNTPCHSTENGSFQTQLTRDLGPQFRILQLKVEDISRDKSEYLAKFPRENNISVLLLQETHTTDADQLRQRGSISGYSIAAATYNRSYGTSTYIRNDIIDWEHVSTYERNNVTAAHIKISELSIINVYKPTNESWLNSDLTPITHPGVIAGDFNSHHQFWGYDNNDPNGVTLNEWTERENIALIFNAKDKGTFRSWEMATRLQFGPMLHNKRS
ncbi:Endonuclease/exonuclease/phosphatase [Cinara cedri]|uniref:Endonuclease/exonuclease/phosphatase n=1 Tax=Cinara cedri TaxID=506608 RepID=A0A5E4MCX0_9HEMI|nr:Endonuclease/exonuclease/phosphatase [Cinara cedri]